MKIVRRDKSNRRGRKEWNGSCVKLDGSRASLLGKFDLSSEKKEIKEVFESVY